jgi:hypothetical protein
MNQQSYSITPFSVSRTYNIVSMTIATMELVLNDHATFLISLKTDEGRLFASFPITISSEEYNVWGGDDSYVISLLETKIAELYTGGGGPGP